MQGDEEEEEEEGKEEEEEEIQIHTKTNAYIEEADWLYGLYFN